MDYTLALTTLIGILLGFCAGLLSFKAKSRWCPRCGIPLRCPRCHLTPTEAMRQ